jgi:hypothetical protein
MGAVAICLRRLAAPQGFEPRYADPESAVLPLNEGAAGGKDAESLLLDFRGCASSGQQNAHNSLDVSIRAKIFSTARHKEPLMVTAIGNVSTLTSEYSEIARRSLEANLCALVVIDIQEKLLPPIFQKEQLIRNSQLLIRLAAILKMPILMTTQYAKGLGSAVPEIASLLPETEAIDKQIFSCFGSDVFCSAEASPGQPQHFIVVRNGESYLRNADRSGRVTGWLSRPRRFRRSEFAHRVELENRAGAHAVCRRHPFFHGDDDL